MLYKINYTVGTLDLVYLGTDKDWERWQNWLINSGKTCKLVSKEPTYKSPDIEFHALRSKVAEDNPFDEGTLEHQEWYNIFCSGD